MAALRDASELVGTWTLISWERRADGALLEEPLGREPIGLLTYDACGYMQVQMIRRGRKFEAYRNRRDAVNKGLRDQPVSAREGDELSEVYSSFAGYAVSYVLDPVEQLVRHHLLTGIDPKMVAAGVQERFAEMHDGGVLELRTRPYKVEGASLVDIIRWRRAKPLRGEGGPDFGKTAA
jgi:hypothetical protein